LNNDRVQAALTEPPVPAVDWTTREIAEQNALHNFLDGIYKLKPGISSIIIYA
jgi:hypothetical protein